ncbi:MAG TPA: hypothetical protein VF914_05615 [Chloroflexia bacterium]|jgi:hypothetical protein
MVPSRYRISIKAADAIAATDLRGAIQSDLIPCLPEEDKGDWEFHSPQPPRGGLAALDPAMVGDILIMGLNAASALITVIQFFQNRRAKVSQAQEVELVITRPSGERMTVKGDLGLLAQMLSERALPMLSEPPTESEPQDG